jgi:uncharacterized protein
MNVERMRVTLDDLRRFAVARNFFEPTTLRRALKRMGFVQADPIRAPARAQDLILRQRVKNYRAGDLERLYSSLDIEEDFFVTYGFVTRALHALMHPRSDSRVPAEDVKSPWPEAQRKRAELLLEFVRDHGAVHPREVDEHFSHGKVTNYWGGLSNATTHLLDAMHYRGMLRVARREKGIRVYSVREGKAAHNHRGETPVPHTREHTGETPVPHTREHTGETPVPHTREHTGETPVPRAPIDELVDAVVRIYAPLAGTSLAFFVRRLRFAAPQWRGELTSALQRAKQRLAQARVDGVDWYWPVIEKLRRQPLEDRVRLLAPFDPLVNDRARFELLWGWVYRFEAYTPAAKRKLGYYAMPLVWRDRVIGWGNLSVKNGELKSEFGYVAPGPPRERAFQLELEAELDRMRVFLRGVESV